MLGNKFLPKYSILTATQEMLRCSRQCNSISLNGLIELNYLMIQKIGDYYVCESEGPAHKNDQNEQQQHSSRGQVFQITGNVKQRLQMIRDRVNELKKAKELSLRQSTANKSMFLSLTPQEDCQPLQLQINISIPEEFLILQKRIDQIESKIQPNELFRQKYQKKGTIVQRIKILQKQLEKLIEKRSPQITIQHIQTYCAHLDEKQEQMKPLFLYEILSKTQSLGQEIQTIEVYLQNLAKIQTKIKSVLPLEIMVKDHNQIVAMSQQTQAKIDHLFVFMKDQYLKVLKQIQEME